MKDLSISELEKYHEDNILIKYNLDADVEFSWTKHEKISDGIFAHYFIKEDVDYILLFKKDIKLYDPFVNNKNLIKPPGKNDDEFIYIKPSTEYVENLTGYFLLYYEY